MTADMTFDTATLTDAITKSARVAPTKGAAYDKAAGILIEAHPVKGIAVIRTTNLEVTYRQQVRAIEGKGDETTWRIPSIIFDGLMQGLDQNEGSTTTIIDRGDGKIRVKSGRVMVAFHMLLARDFPIEVPIPEFTMIPADQLGSTVERVSWACDSKSQILSGIFIDGSRLIGCNQYSVATVPCAIGIDAPLVAPLDTLKSLLRGASDVRLASTPEKLYVALDDETITSTTLIQGNYPKMIQGGSVLRDNFVSTMKIHKTSFLDCMNRLMVLIKQDRMPGMTLEYNPSGLVKMLTFDMNVPDVGRMQDSMDIESDYEEGLFKIGFIPSMLQRGIENAHAEYLDIDFGFADDRSKDAQRSIRIRDGKGYQCYVMPKVE